MDIELQDLLFQLQEISVVFDEHFDGLYRSRMFFGDYQVCVLLRQYREEMAVYMQDVGRLCDLGLSSEQRRVIALACYERVKCMEELERCVHSRLTVLGGE
jgi:hypothetical protein